MSADLSLLKKHGIVAATQEKAEELDSTTQLKQALLGGQAPASPPDPFAEIRFQIQQQRRVEAERKAREEKAWATDDELGTVVGQGKQLLASAVKGGNRLVAEGASFLPAVRGSKALALVPDDARALYAKPNRTPEEEAYLDTVPEFLLKESVNPADHKTYRELMQSAETDLDTAEAIRSGFENSAAQTWVNPLNQDELHEDLGESYAKNAHHFAAAESALEAKDYATVVAETAKGVAKLAVAGAGDIVENPAAAFEFVTEQVPQLAVGGVALKGYQGERVVSLLGATNIAYGHRIYEEALNDYRDEHGRAPTQEEAGEMLGWALSASAAEQLGDTTILSAIRKAPGSKAVSGVLEKQAKKLALNATLNILAAGGGKALDVTLKSADAAKKVANFGVVRALGAGVKGTATEAVTEVYQTAVEENLSRLNTDFDGEQLFTAGVLGGTAGGGISTGGKGLSVLAEAGAKNRQKASKESADKKLKQQIFAQAVETGDVSAYLDETDAKTYDPAQAVAALLARQLSEDVEPADKEAAAKQADELVANQQAKVDQIRDEIDGLIESGNLTGDDFVRLDKAAEKESKALNMMKAARQASAQAELANLDPEAVIEAAQVTETSPEAEQAARATLTLMMRDPNAVTAEEARALAESAAFTPEQKEFLLNFSEEHARTNALKDRQGVNQEVLTGGRGFKGIYEHAFDIAAALRAGDRGAANASLQGLRDFAADHQNKLKALVAAGQTAKRMKEKGQTGTVYVIREPRSEKGYRVTANRPEGWNRERNGGLEVEVSAKGLNGARKLAGSIQEELQAIVAAGKSASSQITLAFEQEQSAPAERPTQEETFADLLPPEDDVPVGLSDGAADELGAQDLLPPKDLLPSEDVLPPKKKEAPKQTKQAKVAQAGNPAQPRQEVKPKPAVTTPPVNTPVAEQAEGEAQPEAEGTATQETAPTVDKLIEEQTAQDAATATAGNVELSDRVRWMEKVGLKKDHHTRADDLLKSLIAMWRDGNFVYNVGDKKFSVPFDSSILEQALDVYEKNIAYWEARNKAGLGDFDRDTQETAALRQHTDDVFDIYTDAAESAIESREPTPQVDPSIVVDGSPFTQGNYRWTQKEVGEEYENNNLCRTCAEHTARMLRKAGLPSATAHMGQLDFSGKTDRLGDHTVALTVVNGVEYIVDHPQRELFAPVNPPKANVGIIQSVIFTPRFIENTPENVQKFYGTDTIAKRAGNVEFQAPIKRPTSEPEIPLESGRAPQLGDPDVRHDGVMSLEELLDPSNNLIELMYDQRGDNAEDGSLNPLVTVKDFMSQVGKTGLIDFTLIKRFLAKGDQELTPAQQNLIAYFTSVWQQWAPQVVRNITQAPDNTYKFNDMVQYFKDDLPENLVTAIVAAGFTWVAENAGGEGYNTDDDIRETLGKTENERVTAEERKLLRDGFLRRNNVIQGLGKKVAQAYGIRAHKNAPADMQNKLELSLGTHALEILIENGIVEQHMLTSPVLERDKNGKQLSPEKQAKLAEDWVAAANAAYLEARHRGLPEANAQSEARHKANNATGMLSHPFIRVVRNADREPTIEAMNILSLSQGLQEDGTRTSTGSILNKLLSVEKVGVEPSQEGRFRNKKIKGTLQKVPEVLTRLLNRSAKRKWRMREDMQAVRRAVSPAVLQQWAGIQTPEYVHEELQKSIGAKNDEILRDMQNLEAFENRLDKPFFFLNPKVWLPQRVGFEQNLVNPQGSKYQRHNITMDAWRVEVDPMEESHPDMLFFKLAVAQGLGVDVDKMLETDSLEAFDALLENRDVRAAVAALQRVPYLAKGDRLTTEEQAAITRAVSAGKGKFHSLDALVNLASYLTAVEQGTTFETDIMFEVDGLTNGPALAHILLGANLERFGPLFGLYKKGAKYRSYVEYKADGNKDLYETVAALMQGYLQQLDPNELAPIYHFVGFLLDENGEVTKDGRTLIKQPLTSMVFGAGIEKAVNNMGEAFVDTFYERIQDDANNGGLTRVQNTVRGFNQMLPEYFSTKDANGNKVQVKAHIPEPQSLEEAMAIRLNTRQRYAASQYFVSRVGEGVKGALEAEFAGVTEKGVVKQYGFLEIRSQMNEAAQAVWARYNAAFEYLVEKKKQEKIADGSLAANNPKKGPRKAYLDLSEQEYEEIREILKPIRPVIHTPMSKASGNLDAGIDMSDTGNQIAPLGSLDHYQEVYLPGKGKKKRTVVSRGITKKSENPGVRAVIMLVHSLDSAIAAYSYGPNAALNIHDALGLGLRQIRKGAKALNRNTYNLAAGYSLPLEIADALQRSFDNEAQLPQDVRDAMAAAQIGFEGNEKLVTRETLELTERVALMAEYNKLSYLAQVETVDQYALQNNNHTVTREERKMVERKRDAIVAKYNGKYRNHPLGDQQLTQRSRLLPSSTPWGPIGEPTVESDPVMVQLLEATPVTKVRNVIPQLARRLKEVAPNDQIREFHNQLLAQISRTINLDTQVNYITPDSRHPNLKYDPSNVRGWYHLGKTGEFINIKSPDFVSSGVTAELLLHEMTHAALAQTIDRLMKKQAVTKVDMEAMAGLREIEILKDLAAQYIAEHNLTQFEPAVESVQEMVAWGMTNTAFQEEVLAKLQMKTKVTERARRSGLVEFIHNLARILFGDRMTKDAPNGLAVLIANTGLLFEAAQQKELNGKAELHLAMANTGPQTFNSEQIFDALGQRPEGEKVSDPMYRSHLKSILQSVVDVAYGPFGVFEASARRSAPATADDVFIEALASGEAPFASKFVGQVSMTMEEAFVAESVEVATRAAMDYSRLAQDEVRAMFNHVKSVIKEPKDLYDGDWAGLTEEAREPYEQVYETLFTVSRNAQGGSDYLSQFLGAAMAYKPLYDALSRMPAPADTRQYFPAGSDFWAGATYAEAIKLLVDRVLKAFSHFVTGTRRHQSAQQQLQVLAKKMAAVRQKRENALQRERDRPDTWIENSTRNLGEATREAIQRVSDSRFFRDSKSEFVQTIGEITSTIAGDRVGLFMDLIKKTRDGASQSRLGVVAEMYNEMRGERDINTWAHQLLAEANKYEQDRKRAIIETAKFVRDSFGRKLTKEEMKALTRVVLRTDLTSLLQAGFTLPQITEMLESPTAMRKTIRDLESQLAGTTHEDYYLTSAKGLGYFLATGKVRVPNLMLNARNIAFLAGTSQVIRTRGKEAQEAQQAMGVIDPLVTLYALSHTSQNWKDQVVKVARDEAGRDDGGNGFDLVLRLHQEMQRDSLENLFDNDPTLMMKGYTKDIYNPHIEVVAATAAEAEGLVAAGYTPVGTKDLNQDPADPTGEARQLYQIQDRGLSSTVTGFMSSTGRRRRGWSIHQGLHSLTDDQINRKNARLNAAVVAKKAQQTQAMFQNGHTFDPTRQPNVNLMVPVINSNGEAVNYRYLMEESTKDEVLERDNRLDKVLGNMAGSLLDKQNAPVMNAAGIDALKAQYDEDYLRNQEAYIEFGPDSADAAIRERWHLLPDDTKRYIRQVWGTNGMMIRNDLYNIAMGYRKFSLSEMFNKGSYWDFRQARQLGQNVDEDAYRSMLQEVFVVFWERILGKKAALRILQAENIWQELVKEVKDIWVIKNFFTLLGNETSNLTVLLLSGVPIKDIIHYKAVAYKATKDFQHDRRRKRDLERMISLGVLGPNEMAAAQQELIQIEDSMARNPMKVLIDAGMFQTLVEDIAQEEDPYSYKSRLTRKVDKWTLADSENRLVRLTRGVGKTLLMTHDTPIYKFMNEMTIMSDFTSRYVLHQHLTTRSRNPMSSAEALQRARAAFVNYDVPTHKALQYLNDMGLLWFTKYYLRIQAVIITLVRENPARALALIGADHFFHIADILDSSMFNKWPGNLGAGALELPGAIPEIWTLRAATPL